jgi:hypothetical protein
MHDRVILKQTESCTASFSKAATGGDESYMPNLVKDCLYTFKSPHNKKTFRDTLKISISKG